MVSLTQQSEATAVTDNVNLKLGLVVNYVSFEILFVAANFHKFVNFQTKIVNVGLVIRKWGTICNATVHVNWTIALTGGEIKGIDTVCTA